MSGTNIYGELVRAQLQQSASDLTPTATGLVYFNTTTGVKWYTGAAWLTAADLTTSQVFTNKDYDGGTASDTSRVTLPKASSSTLNALTRKEATLVYDTTTSQVKYDNGTSLLAVGSSSGAGEINAVLNPSVADTTTGWTNGTSHTLTRVTSGSPLDPVITTALSIAATTTATESATSGEYYSIASLASGLRNKKLKIEFYFTTEASQTWAISVWQGATRKSLSTDSSGATTLPAGTTGKFTAYLDTDSSAAYTVNFTRTAGSGTATLLVTSVILGPGIQPQGAVVSATVQFSPTISGLGTGSVTTATTDFFYYRSGQNMIAWGAITKDGSAGSGASDVNMSMPSGLTIDVNYLPESTSVLSQINRLGPWNIRNASGKYGHVNPASTTALRFSRQDTSSSDLSGADIGSGAVLAFGPLVIPIAEWAGSGTLNTVQNDEEFAYTSGTWDADSSTTVAGQSGIATGGALTADRTKTITWQRNFQTGDKVVLEVADANYPSQFVDCAGVFPYVLQNTLGYGARVVQSGVNQTQVIFYRYRRSTGATFGSAGEAWNTGSIWRLRKISAGTAVGVANASDTASGFLKAGVQSDSGYSAQYLSFKASVNGSANKDTVIATGIAGFKNLITCSFLFSYSNSNGTTMGTSIRILVKDTTSGSTLYNLGATVIAVPTGFNGPLHRSCTVIVPPPTGTTYTIETYEENSGGGSYAASHGTTSVSVAKVIV